MLCYFKKITGVSMFLEVRTIVPLAVKNTIIPPKSLHGEQFRSVMFVLIGGRYRAMKQILPQQLENRILSESLINRRTLKSHSSYGFIEIKVFRNADINWPSRLSNLSSLNYVLWGYVT